MVFSEILPVPRNLLPRHSSALIIGPKNVCKKSFLFRFAYSIVMKNENLQVLFISPNKIDKLPGLTFEGSDL